MNILITGSNGFVRKNLVASLKSIKDCKYRTHPDIIIDEIFEYDVDTGPELLKTENLVTVMWANEQFDPTHPDTFFEVVE